MDRALRASLEAMLGAEQNPHRREVLRRVLDGQASMRELAADPSFRPEIHAGTQAIRREYEALTPERIEELREQAANLGKAPPGPR